MQRTTIALLLTAILITPKTLATSQPAPSHLTCPPSSNECYTPQQVKKIAQGLREREACQVELALARQFIIDSKQRHAPTSEWWQEPSLFGGSVVLSFITGAVLMHTIQKK